MAVRQYIGARYVPKFMGTYDPTTDYEALSVVDNGMGTSYTSKKPTPAGTPLTDTDYWAVTGSLNGAIIQLQNDVLQLQGDMTTLDAKVDSVKANPTVADLIANTALVDGDVAYTGGFYAAGDGGEGTYLITSAGTPDNMFVFAMSNGLYANLIYGDDLNILQIGAHKDGLTDDTAIIQAAFDNARHIIIPEGEFQITGTLYPANGTVISGVYDTFDRARSVIKTSNNITLVSFAGKVGGITFSGVVLSHPDTNTQPVTDFTGARYIKLIDVKFEHPTDANCIAIWSDPLSADWNGYLIFDCLYASNYKNSINLTTATLCSCTDCKFNNTSSNNIVYSGEIINLRGCEITNQTKTPPIKYTGIYGVNMMGCYAEDIPVQKLIEHSGTEDLAYMINGGMKYTWSRIANSFNGYARHAAFTKDGSSPSVLEQFCDGYQGDNWLQNGTFGFGKLGWDIDAAANAVVQNCNENGYYKELYCQPSGGADIKQTLSNLPTGKYTFSCWVKIEGASEGYSLNLFVNDTNNTSNVLGRASYSSLGVIPNNKWHLVTMVFDSTHDAGISSVDVRIRANATVPKLHITGCQLRSGVYTGTLSNGIGGNTIYTNKLVIRGTDNHYYRLNITGGAVDIQDITSQA